MIAVDVKLRDPSVEPVLVRVIRQLLGRCTVDELQSVAVDCQRLLADELESRGIRLVDARVQNSIGLFFVCYTMPSLVELKQLITDGRLTVILEKLFQLLLMEPLGGSAANGSTIQDTILLT
jgi:hypothetical protein